MSRLAGFTVVEIKGKFKGFVRVNWAGTATVQEIKEAMEEAGITPAFSKDLDQGQVDGTMLVAIGDIVENQSSDPDFNGLRSHLAMCPSGVMSYVALEQRLGKGEKRAIHTDENLNRLHVLGIR